MSENIAQFETCEMAAFADVYRSVPEDVAKNHGIHVKEIEGALFLAVSSLDVLAFNRVLGFGVNKPATEAQIELITQSYREAGAKRFFIQVSPAAQPDNVTQLLENQGLYHYNNWVRLHRATSNIPPIDTSLDVREIGKGEAETFARIVVESFEWPEHIAALVAAPVGRPGWHHYMAYENDTPVATAALFEAGEFGWLDFAATVEAHRGKGAQKALIVRRLQDAAAAGCREVIVETGQQKPDHEAPSYRNMIKLGFSEDYLRPNYIMAFDS